MLRFYCATFLVIILALAGCAEKRVPDMEEQSLRLTSLEDKVYKDKKEQDSINANVDKRLLNLEGGPKKVATQKNVAGKESSSAPAVLAAPDSSVKPEKPLPGKSPKGADLAREGHSRASSGSSASSGAKAPAPSGRLSYTSQSSAVFLKNDKAAGAAPLPPASVEAGVPENAAAFDDATTSESAFATPPKAEGKALAEPKKKYSTSKKQGAESSSDKVSYQASLALMEKGKVAAGQEGMEKFLAANPNSPLAPNAMYWKGEALYTQHKYEDAIISFKEIVGKYPKSNKAPDALLKIGMSYLKLSDKENAKFHFQMLLDDYGKSSVAALAKRQMTGLK